MPPPGQDQVKQQQIKVSASPTQVNIDPGTDDTTGAESIRLVIENQLPPVTGGSQHIMPGGGPDSCERQQQALQLQAQIQQQQASNQELMQDLQEHEQQDQERQDQEQRAYEQNQMQQDRQEES